MSNYIDKTSTKYLRDNTKEYKNRLSLQGRVFIDCLIVSPNGFKSREIGEASGNIGKHYEKIKFQAQLNAIYKHVKAGGRTGGDITKIYEIWFHYFDERIKTKRVYFKPRGKQKKGSYRNITRINGKIIANDKWSSKLYDDEERLDL